MKKALVGACVVVCLMLSSTAMSAGRGTPDGSPPANENICNPLQSHTRGLYGLCVAYCEAHDAERLSPGGDAAELNIPNRRLLDNYRKKMQAGDPDMPCVQSSSACPCWTPNQLAALPAPSTAEAADALNEDACFSAPSFAVLENAENQPATVFQLFVFPTFCSVISFGLPDGPATTQVDGLTADQSAACRDTLITHALVDATADIWPCWNP